MARKRNRCHAICGLQQWMGYSRSLCVQSVIFEYGSTLAEPQCPAVIGSRALHNTDVSTWQCFPTCVPWHTSVPREWQRCAECRKSKVFNEKFQRSFQLSLK